MKKKWVKGFTGKAFLQLILIILISFLSRCHFDATPPDSELLSRGYPEFSIAIQGLAVSLPVYIRYWESDRAYTYGSSYGLKTSRGGNILFSVQFLDDLSDKTFQIYIDKNQNNRIDGSDGGLLFEHILFSSENILSYNFVATDISAVYSVSATGVYGPSSVYYCFFAPPEKENFNPNSDDLYVDRAEKKQKKPLLDREPYLTFQTDSAGNISTQSSAFLVNGKYLPRCLKDENINKEYETGETIYDATPITVSGGPVNLSF